MRKFFNLTGLVLTSFLLGAYAASHFRHNEPVETYRWLISSFFWMGFLLLTLKDRKS